MTPFLRARVWLIPLGARRCSTWVGRLKSASKLEKAIIKARAIAEANAAIQKPTFRGSCLRGATRNLRDVPQLQPPQEMFNAAMKEVRRLRPRQDIPKESSRAANLVWTTILCQG